MQNKIYFLSSKEERELELYEKSCVECVPQKNKFFMY